MKIFLSWSGNQSRLLASALNEWLPSVFQSVVPFFSPDDIEAGEKWQDRLNTVLEDHDFGIVCLTKTNLRSPFVMFESGALAKRLTKSKVMPILCDIPEAYPDLAKHPLLQFQYVHLNKDVNKEGIWTLAKSLNSSLGSKALKEGMLKSTFDVWWPKFEEKIEQILAASEAPEKEEFHLQGSIEELLSIVRGLERTLGVPGPLTRAFLWPNAPGPSPNVDEERTLNEAIAAALLAAPHHGEKGEWRWHVRKEGDQKKKDGNAPKKPKDG